MVGRRATDGVRGVLVGADRSDDGDGGERRPDGPHAGRLRPDGAQADRAQADQGQPDKGQLDRAQFDKGQADQGQPGKARVDEARVDEARVDEARVDEARVGRPGRDVPGLARGAEAPWAGGSRAGEGGTDHGAEIAARDRAIGELASENADLYKRVDALEAKVKAGEAKLKNEQDRFRAWASVVANRDAERDARDEARDKREESLIDQVKELRGTVADLKRELTQRPDAIDPGDRNRRLDRQEAVGRQAVKRNPERLWRTNEALDLYTSGGGALLTVFSDVVRSGAVAEATGLAGTLLTFGAAIVAFVRKRGEGRNADRS